MYEIIDLHFQGFPHVIASYVLRGPDRVAVIETGPASTYPALKAGLAGLGIELTQVTDVLVTHVHLDHAGAAGWLARESGATVHVHTVGAPHLADPGKLLSSAQRIYGEDMDWCVRAKKAGWKVMYYPHAQIVHYKGVGCRTNNRKTTYEFYRAMVLFHKKHFARECSCLTNLVVYVGIFVTAMLAWRRWLFNAKPGPGK